MIQDIPKRAKIWGLHAEPGRGLSIFLGLLPFLLLLVVYFTASRARHLENPDDKVLPTLSQMGDAIYDMAIVEDPREGTRLMVSDTVASLTRIGIAISLAALTGLLLGLHLGVYGGWRSVMLPFVTFVSIVPPLALLPILFISFGVDELAKIILIFVGTFPAIARDIFGAVRKLPNEQRTKALTLGANGLTFVYRIVMPQIMPRLVETVRLSLGSAWLFLIAAEAIAAEAGLGYRIFLVRRYLAMDIIIPYALWITLLGFLVDQLLKRFNLWMFPWYHDEKQ